MDTVLTLDHVSKIYHNGRGARNITFSVERGQVVGLLGPNGSGKTTIMKSITGLSQPTEGTITVFGAPVTDREKALMQVGALIEQPALYENLTAQDHLRMASKIISSGSDSSARARPIRCFMPRENFPHRSLRYGVSPTISSTLSMRAWSTPG